MGDFSHFLSGKEVKPFQDNPRDRRDIKMWRKLNPAVRRHWLFAIAGVVWTSVGVLLCVRAIVWLAPFALGTNLAAELLAVTIAVIGYIFGFSLIVKKNIVRIQALPERSCAFAFTAWRGYLVIGMMVAIGLALRSSPIPKHYLSVPYSAMGCVLLLGGAAMFRQFLDLATPGK